MGTVVAVHGAPGSHKDFKYVTPYLTEKGVRVIGVNWPGQGYSSCKGSYLVNIVVCKAKNIILTIFR